MHRSIVRPDGTLHLGEAARALGFQPGQLVEIILTRSGSLIVAKADDDSQAVDAFARRLSSSEVVPQLTEKSVVR